ncbi:MAG: ATP-binding cassette domain-containing protein [Gammaproteobacteria bacterium]
MFRLDNRTVSYAGKPVLIGISLAISAGEKVALVGESGAGKSTVLRLLREQQPSAVAWCPQAQGLVPVLSVFHNIYMGRLDRHSAFYNLGNLLSPRARDVIAVRAVTGTLGLDEKLWTSVDRLSGGQQQRVAVGRALFAARPVFLGDEPVSAVDEYQARDIVRAIHDAHDTVVLALHDIELALSTCDRIIGLKHGKVALDAPSAALTPHELAPLYRHPAA